MVGGYPPTRSGWDIPPDQVWMGYPPPTRSGWWGVLGVPPDQVWMGYPPTRSRWWGVPQVSPLTRSGWGTPRPGLDGGGYPRYPPRPGLDGVPPDQVWMVGATPPPRQSSIASTCYAAGDVYLAFTQEDFLVYSLFCSTGYKDELHAQSGRW